MMPVTLRRSGPDFIGADGAKFEPRAIIATCEGCGRPAPFGEGVSLLQNKPGAWYCGYSSGRPVCVNQRAEEARDG